jgi:plasmid stability protein
VAVNLSIKNVPDELAEKLRQRARKSHRSLQGELMRILEEAVKEEEKLTPMMVLERVQKYKVSTPEESVDMIREDRDAR